MEGEITPSESTGISQPQPPQVDTMSVASQPIETMPVIPPPIETMQAVAPQINTIPAIPARVRTAPNEANEPKMKTTLAMSAIFAAIPALP